MYVLVDDSGQKAVDSVDSDQEESRINDAVDSTGVVDLPSDSEDGGSSDSVDSDGEGSDSTDIDTDALVDMKNEVQE